MKRFITNAVNVLLFYLIPSILYAQTDTASSDINSYAKNAAYGFFIILAIFFIFILYYNSRPESEKIYEVPEHSVLPSGAGLSQNMINALNIFYYAVIVLLVIYFVMFIFFIF